MLVSIFPFHPKTAKGWIILFTIALPLSVLYEMLGEVIFERKFLQRWNSPWRILYGVIMISLLIAISIGLLYLLKPTLAQWLIG
jgi:hypothetical protein